MESYTSVPFVGNISYEINRMTSELASEIPDRYKYWPIEVQQKLAIDLIKNFCRLNYIETQQGHKKVVINGRWPFDKEQATISNYSFAL